MMHPQTALSYQARGWSLFPAWPRSKRPYSELLPCVDGKPSWKPFQSTPPSREQVALWWKIAPSANIMIVTGAVSQLVVLDFDTAEALYEARARGGWASTPTVRGRRGVHCYFRHPGFAVRGSLGIPDLDVQGEGRTATAPPSVHQSGYQYQWTAEPSVPLAPLPGWALAILKANHETREAARSTRASCPAPITCNGSPYARKVLQSTLDRLRSTRGNRNDELNRAAYVLGGWVAGGSLDAPTVRGALESTAASIGLQEHEIGPTIESGLRSGMSEPKVPPLPKFQTNTKRRFEKRRFETNYGNSILSRA